MKKTVGNYKKLGTTPNHHSITISPQPLQSEKSSLHDKTLENMKYKTKKEQERRDMVSFPEVKGAEGNYWNVCNVTSLKLCHYGLSIYFKCVAIENFILKLLTNMNWSESKGFVRWEFSTQLVNVLIVALHWFP